MSMIDEAKAVQQRVVKLEGGLADLSRRLDIHLERLDGNSERLGGILSTIEKRLAPIDGITLADAVERFQAVEAKLADVTVAIDTKDDAHSRELGKILDRLDALESQPVSGTVELADPERSYTLRELRAIGFLFGSHFVEIGGGAT